MPYDNSVVFSFVEFIIFFLLLPFLKILMLISILKAILDARYINVACFSNLRTTYGKQFH